MGGKKNTMAMIIIGMCGFVTGATMSSTGYGISTAQYWIVILSLVVAVYAATESN